VLRRPIETTRFNRTRPGLPRTGLLDRNNFRLPRDTGTIDRVKAGPHLRLANEPGIYAGGYESMSTYALDLACAKNSLDSDPLIRCGSIRALGVPKLHGSGAVGLRREAYAAQQYVKSGLVTQAIKLGIYL